MAIDFDGLFERYVKGHLRMDDNADDDTVEEAALSLYEDFLKTPLPELDGFSTEEYFAPMGVYALCEEYVGAIRDGLEPSDYLTELILHQEGAEPALCELLGDETLGPCEGAGIISLLMDLESRSALPLYREILINEDADPELADAAAEAVIALNDKETASMLLRALPDTIEQGCVHRNAEILSYLPVKGTYETLIALFTHAPDAFFAQCLMRLGDPRAADALIDATKLPNLRYGDYLAFRDAAEALGAFLEEEREFYGDPDYEQIRTMGEES